MGKRDYEDKEVDKELENGPVDKRSCTDILCCLFFLVALGAMYVLFTIAMVNGKPEYIPAIYDADSRPCGLHPDTKDYPYAYFTNPPLNQAASESKSWQLMVLCVKSCPTNTTTVLECKPTTQDSLNCDGYSFSTCTSTYSTSKCASMAQEMAAMTRPLILPSNPFYNSVCLPDMSSDEAKMAGQFLQQILGQVMGTAQVISDDLKNAAWVVASCILVSLVIGLFYMCFLRIFAGLLVFITIMSYLLGLTALGFMMLQESKKLGDDGSSQDNYKYIAYTIWAVAAISALFFCCFRNALRLAVAIVKSAGMFLMDCKTVLAVPIIGYVLFLGVFSFWLVGFVYLYSTGDPMRMDTFPFNKFGTDEKGKQLLYYWIFMGFWKQAFIAALVQFVIASSCAIWYFSQGTGQLVTAPVSKSFYRAFRYHLGSLAFGSFILAVVRMIRFMLYQMQKQAQASGENAVTKNIIKCLQCYMVCFERFIEFLNKNAYIQVAISGKNFCTSAKNAFLLILRNPVRFAMLGMLGNIFTYLGILIVAAGGTFFGYSMSTYDRKLKHSLHSPWTPTAACLILSTMIAIIFMSVYSMSIDTILQCFFLDEELAKTNPNYVGHQPSYIKDLMGDVDKKAAEKAASKAKKDDDAVSHNVRD